MWGHDTWSHQDANPARREPAKSQPICFVQAQAGLGVPDSLAALPRPPRRLLATRTEQAARPSGSVASCPHPAIRGPAEGRLPLQLGGKRNHLWMVGNPSLDQTD